MNNLENFALAINGEKSILVPIIFDKYEIEKDKDGFWLDILAHCKYRLGERHGIVVILFLELSWSEKFKIDFVDYEHISKTESKIGMIKYYGLGVEINLIINTGTFPIIPRT